MVRQANWRKVGGGSPPERRRNRSTFLREPCVGVRERTGEASVAISLPRLLSCGVLSLPPDVSRNVIRCHGLHAPGTWPMCRLGMRPVRLFFLSARPVFPGLRPLLPLACKRALTRLPARAGGACPAAVPLRRSPVPPCPACRSFLLFRSTPFPPPRRPSRAAGPCFARIAAARFARPIAPVRPTPGRKAHLSCRLHGSFVAPARIEAASESRLDPTHIGIDVPEGKPKRRIFSYLENKAI